MGMLNAPITLGDVLVMVLVGFAIYQYVRSHPEESNGARESLRVS